MEIAITKTRTGTSAWVGFGMCSPKAQHQGSGLPFAGYAALAVVPTAARTADAKVPDPRGRQR